MAQNAALAATSPQKKSKKRARRTVNDLNLKEWKKYDDLLTDSLWLFPERDSSGTHSADYHGNFVPQIPYQVISRFTKRDEIVLDTFLGSGTTLIEAKKMGRHGIGLELQEGVAAIAKERIKATDSAYQDAKSRIFVEDSLSHRAKMKVRNAVHSLGREELQLIVAHPPYHDIIQFSENPEDLSNAENTEAFCENFGKIFDVYVPMLEKKRYFVLVIGDKYSGGEWIPLGFYLMQEALKRDLSLKSLIVKNMAGNRAKRNRENLWRYRALYGGFYIFKHEYVMIFKKN